MTTNIQKMVHLATRVDSALFRLVPWIYSGKPRETKKQVMFILQCQQTGYEAGSRVFILLQ